MTIFYTVASGCNSRHLFDVDVFDRLKDAKQFILSVKNAYLLQRHEEKTPFDRSTKKLDERVI